MHMSVIGIKEQLVREKIYHWELAKEIGISHSTLSVWFRELTAEREKRIVAAIDRLREGVSLGKAE